MHITDDAYGACASYLLENLQDQATEYSLSKSLELLREGDDEGATFWAKIYLALVKAIEEVQETPSKALH